MKKLISLTGPFTSRLVLAGCYVAAVSLFIMVLFLTFEIVARSLFNFSTLLSVEVAGYLLVCIAFLGLAYCLKTGGHIQVEIVVGRVSPMIRDLMRLVACVGGAIYSSLITYSSYHLVIDSFSLRATSIYISHTPLYLPQALVPIGMGLLTLQLTVEAFHTIRSLQRRRVCHGRDDP